MVTRKRFFAGIFLAAAVAATGAAHARRDDDFKQVPAKELVKNPQFYWAQGIIFNDTITEVPAGVARQMGERRVVPFRTKIVGECFADEVLVSALRNAKPGAECIFSGTVFQESGWFSSKFHIVAQQFTVAMTNLVNTGTMLANLPKNESNEYAQTARRLDGLVARIQADLLSYCNAKNITMEELFDPASPHRDHLRQIVNDGVRKLEEESRAPASLFLNNLVTAMLAGRYGAPVAPQPVTIAPAPQLEIPAETKKPAGEKSAEPKSETTPSPPAHMTPPPIQGKTPVVDAPVPAGTAAETEKPPVVVSPDQKKEPSSPENKPSFLGSLFGSAPAASSEKKEPTKSKEAPVAVEKTKPEAKKTILPAGPAKENAVTPQRESDYAQPVPVAKPPGPEKADGEKKDKIVDKKTEVKKDAAPPRQTSSFFGRVFGVSTGTTTRAVTEKNDAPKTNVPPASAEKTNSGTSKAVAPAAGNAIREGLTPATRNIPNDSTTARPRKSASSQPTNEAPAIKAAAAPGKKRSFWESLFGSGDSTNKAPSAASSPNKKSEKTANDPANKVLTQPEPARQGKPAQTMVADRPVPMAEDKENKQGTTGEQTKKARPAFWGRLFSSNTNAAESGISKTSASGKTTIAPDRSAEPVAKESGPTREEMETKTVRSTGPQSGVGDEKKGNGSGGLVKNIEPAGSSMPTKEVQARNPEEPHSLLGRFFGSSEAGKPEKKPATGRETTGLVERSENETMPSEVPAKAGERKGSAETKVPGAENPATVGSAVVQNGAQKTESKAPTAGVAQAVTNADTQPAAAAASGKRRSSREREAEALANEFPAPVNAADGKNENSTPPK